MQWLFSIIILLLISPLSGESYRVDFSGISEECILQELKSRSDILLLEENPPTSRVNLKRRIDEDIQSFVRILHSHAYYNARVDATTDFSQDPSLITFTIHTGPVYPLHRFTIRQKEGAAYSFDLSSLESLVTLDAPATPKSILATETLILQTLKCQGYPFAEILKREVFANQETKAIEVDLLLDSGPLTRFGPLTITGNKRVCPAFFKKKTAWCEGDIYSPLQINATERALEASRLFNTLSIDHEGEVDEEGRVPMVIHVKERKPRSIGLGINYASQRGPGASAEWEHRNFRGMGETLSFRTNLWSDLQDGRLSYLIPDFGCEARDLIYLAECRREVTEGYIARSISLSALIDRRYSRTLRFSYGLMLKHLLDTDIHEKKDHQEQKTTKENFNLFKVPLNISWNRTNDLLDPRYGYTARLKTVPSWNFTNKQFFYDINVLTLTGYTPLTDRLVLASKGTFGSIVGTSKQTIPRSELFDAGTDELLRGYKYMTVSPLDDEGDPTGGRSMMIYSLEARVRINKQFGVVGFYDFGNVYSSVLPDLNDKILNSVGAGVRYFTPVGPVRIDVAFPLNFRKGCDTSHYQFYLSIGQAF